MKKMLLAPALLLPAIGSAQAVCPATTQSAAACSGTTDSQTVTSACVCVAAEVGAEPDSTLLTGLVSYWPLDETSGVRADAHGSNDLTDNNTVGYQNMGPAGTVAAHARATTEFFSSSAAAFKGDGAFTVAGWVNVTGTTVNQGIVGRDNGAQRDYSLIGNNNGTGSVFLQFYHLNGGFPSVSTTVPEGWRFIVIYISGTGGTMALIVDDGTPVTNTAAALQDLTVDFTIGATAGSGPQDMQSSRFGFWDGVLDSSVITSLYNSGVGKSYADLTTAEKVGLVSYWDLDEAGGNRADSHGSNTLTDNNTVGSATNSYPANLPGTAAKFISANSEYLSKTDPGWDEAAGFTLVFWWNGNSSAPHVSRDNSTTERSWMLYGGDVNFYGFSDDTTFTALNINTGGHIASDAWLLFIVWYDPSDKKLRSQISNNTVYTSSAVAGAGLQTQAAPFLLGGSNVYSVYNNALFGPTMFYNRVLTSTERSCLYAAGAGVAYPFTGVCTP